MSHAKVDAEFQALLRTLRYERGLSIRRLGKLAFISKSHVSNLEIGRSNPSATTAAALDRALDARGALASLVVEDRTRHSGARLPTYFESRARDAALDALGAAAKTLSSQPPASPTGMIVVDLALAALALASERIRQLQISDRVD